MLGIRNRDITVLETSYSRRYKPCSKCSTPISGPHWARKGGSQLLYCRTCVGLLMSRYGLSFVVRGKLDPETQLAKDYYDIQLQTWLNNHEIHMEEEEVVFADSIGFNMGFIPKQGRARLRS